MAISHDFVMCLPLGNSFYSSRPLHVSWPLSVPSTLREKNYTDKSIIIIDLPV